MDYLTPGQLAARYLGTISVRTLANWRSKGEGPPFVKIGGRVLYSVAAVIEWERTRVRETIGRDASAAIAAGGLLTFGMLARAVDAIERAAAPMVML